MNPLNPLDFARYIANIPVPSEVSSAFFIFALLGAVIAVRSIRRARGGLLCARCAGYALSALALGAGVALNQHPASHVPLFQLGVIIGFNTVLWADVQRFGKLNKELI